MFYVAMLIEVEKLNNYTDKEMQKNIQRESTYFLYGSF